MVKRKKYILRYGKVIDVEEYHDGRYGARGKPREEKRKLTPEQMQKVNETNKAKLCQRRLLHYFRPGDCFATWTYKPENRPPDMERALEDFKKAIRIVRAAYKKRGRELFWIRNIERGTKGAWHIHLIVNEIGDTASILMKAWKHGGVWFTEIKESKYYAEDFAELASYMTKSERTVTYKEDGTPEKPRLSESSYSTSRNMPLPEPKEDKLLYWKKEVKPKKGYYISNLVEGINPVTGYKYRHYTMLRLKGEEDGERKRRNAGSRTVHRHNPPGKRKRTRPRDVPAKDKAKDRAGLRKHSGGGGVCRHHGKEAGASGDSGSPEKA